MKKKIEDVYNITKAQHDFILAMQDWGCPDFTGTTIDDASKYISKNKERFYTECEFDHYYPM